MTDTIAADAELDLRVDADLAHMLTVRGWLPPTTTPVEREPLDGGLRIARAGADGVRRATTVTTDPPAARGPDGTGGCSPARSPTSTSCARRSTAGRIRRRASRGTRRCSAGTR